MQATDDPRTIIDGDAYTVQRTIHISASIDKVWAAVTEPGHMSKWFAPTTTLDGRGVGATGFFTFDRNDSIPVRIEEIDAPRMIAYCWSNDDAAAAKAGGAHPATIDDDHSLVMRFTLEATAHGTQLTVVETGFETTTDPAYNMESHRRGWNGILDQLIAHFA
jgi:uncharacterized protein YndB with AHSA1/START domain